MQLFIGLLLSLRLGPGPEATPFTQPQLAVSSNVVALTFGGGNSIYYSGSTDGAQTFSAPVRVASSPGLMLGKRRGPRIAISGDSFLITAVSSDEKGRGDLLGWRSTDHGKTWSGPHRINDVPASAREGLQSISANGNRIFATWLDLRSSAMQLYGAVSHDGGKT